MEINIKEDKANRGDAVMLINFLYEFLWVGCTTEFEKMLAFMLFSCVIEAIFSMCGLLTGGRHR